MNTPRARAISEYLASGIWDEHGEYNFDTDPEDYGYFQAEGRAVLPRRSELKQELYNNSTEEAEDAEYFRLVEEKSKRMKTSKEWLGMRCVCKKLMPPGMR